MKIDNQEKIAQVGTKAFMIGAWIIILIWNALVVLGTYIFAALDTSYLPGQAIVWLSAIAIVAGVFLGYKRSSWSYLFLMIPTIIMFLTSSLI